MIHRLRGTVGIIGPSWLVVDVSGVGFQVFTSAHTISQVPPLESPIELRCHLHVTDDALALYGFATADELVLFEQLLSVSGVGPKSALSILDVAHLGDVRSAIAQARPDLLTKASGIGRKTAERIILELKGKVVATDSRQRVQKMEADGDLVETLVSLGYRREQAREALEAIGPDISDLQLRLKEALKWLHPRR